MLEALKYTPEKLELLNQLLLPHETVFEEANTAEEGWHQIRLMKVRGAPAIAIVAALSLAVELHHLKGTSVNRQRNFKDAAELVAFIKERWDHLKTSRPTAVNLFEAAAKFVTLVEKELEAKPDSSVDSIIDLYLEHAKIMLDKDIEDNKAIGKHGGQAILEIHKKDKVVVMTHCNTGSLATSGYGTALGVVRFLHEKSNLEHAYCCETRPYNQGSRLTAYELVTEKIPSTLITDSMASALMSKKEISAIVVGADRIAANGDTANKIGTYQLAISAQYHKVPFYVCAPVTSIDLAMETGASIEIEQRKPEEVTHVTGALTSGPGGEILEPLEQKTVRIAPHGIGVWNPAFDVTPASLITGIVTEKGVIEKQRGETTFKIKEFLKKN